MSFHIMQKNSCHQLTINTYINTEALRHFFLTLICHVVRLLLTPMSALLLTPNLHLSVLLVIDVRGSVACSLRCSSI